MIKRKIYEIKIYFYVRKIIDDRYSGRGVGTNTSLPS